MSNDKDERSVDKDERGTFEKWLEATYDSNAEWDAARNCYYDPSVHMAWQAWRAHSTLPELQACPKCGTPFSARQERKP